MGAGNGTEVALDAAFLRANGSAPAPGPIHLQLWPSSGPTGARSNALLTAIERWVDAVANPVTGAAWYRFDHVLVNGPLLPGSCYYVGLYVEQAAYRPGVFDWLSRANGTIPGMRWVDGFGNFINNTALALQYSLFQTGPTGTAAYSTTGRPVSYMTLVMWVRATAATTGLAVLPLLPGRTAPPPPSPAPSPAPSPPPTPSVMSSPTTPPSTMALPPSTPAAPSTTMQSSTPLAPSTTMQSSTPLAPPTPQSPYSTQLVPPPPTPADNTSNIVPPPPGWIPPVSLATGVWAGAIISGIIALALVGALIYLVIQRRRAANQQSTREYELQQGKHPDDVRLVGLEEDEEDDHDKLPEITIEKPTPTTAAKQTSPSLTTPDAAKMTELELDTRNGVYKDEVCHSTSVGT